MQDGVASASHPFHQCALATISLNKPELRTVVLRKWDLSRRTLIFHTDIRSPKVSQLKKEPYCSLLFYSRPDKIQARFDCVSHIHHNNRLSQVSYEKLTDSQRQCYQWPIAPSEKIDFVNMETYMSQSSKIKKVDPINNFCVIVCNFNKLEVLKLQHDGHVRVLYDWNKKGELTTTNLVA